MQRKEKGRVLGVGRLFGTCDFSKSDYKLALGAQGPRAAEPARLINICKRDKSQAFTEHLG